MDIYAILYFHEHDGKKKTKYTKCYNYKFSIFDILYVVSYYVRLVDKSESSKLTRNFPKMQNVHSLTINWTVQC